MNAIILTALVVTGLGFSIVLFKLLKKTGGFAKKVPTNFLIVGLIFALLGLTGFLVYAQFTYTPLAISCICILTALATGLILAQNLEDRWEWSKEYSMFKKFGYLAAVLFTGLVFFVLVFVLCQNRGWPQDRAGWNSVSSYAPLLLAGLLPLLVRIAHKRWNEIPMVRKLKRVFKIKLGVEPPFIETGSEAYHFQFVIPQAFRSEEKIHSKVAVPYNITLGDVFHYKLHEHNVVKQYQRKIAIAEDNSRSKVYDWLFYRIVKGWFGFVERKQYLNPYEQIGRALTNGEIIYVERERSWLKQ